MLSSTAPGSVEQEEQASTSVRASLVTRKIWLPRLVYDALPYFYLTAGFTAFFATLYINQWFWVLPHYLMFSAGCVHFGLLVYRKRHAPQTDPTETDSDSPGSATA